MYGKTREVSGMTPEGTNLFPLIRAIFWGTPVPAADRTTFEEMKAQSVAVLPGEWLKKHPIPGASAWQAYCNFQQAQWMKMIFRQNQLLKLLDQNGTVNRPRTIDMILKDIRSSRLGRISWQNAGE